MANSENNQDGISRESESRIDAMFSLRTDAVAKTNPAGAPDLPGASDNRVESPKVNIQRQAADEGSTQTIAEKSLDNGDDPVVDAIVAREGDDLLKAQDCEIAKAFDPHRPTLRERIQEFFLAWWDNRLARYGTVGALVALVATAAVLPTSRYFVMNAFGMRATASLTVLDNTTGLPLPNVNVAVGGIETKSNKEGVAKLYSVKLGAQTLTIHQVGFADVTKNVTLGIGDNTFGGVGLKAVGSQVAFKVVDYLSGKSVAGATASAGDANAKADKKGKITLTIGGSTTGPVSAKLTAEGYRSEKITVTPGSKEPIAISLVSARKEVYVSKQSGKYDLYKVDLDGKNKKVLLAGTGTERENISLVVNAANDTAALVSSRENKRNGDGYLFDALTLVNIADGTTLSLDHSESIRIVDWIGDRLVYVKIKAGTSAGNAERYQLVSYNTTNTNRQILAAANNFNDIVSAKGVIYYAASNSWYPGGQSQFARVNPDNTGKQTLLNAEVWNILRHSYNNLELFGNQKWWNYRLGDTTTKELAQSPTDANSNRFYLDAPDGKHSLWTDTRDGKGVLLSYDTEGGEDATLATQSGLTYPLQWLDDHTVLYRVVTPSESAAYAVSLNGGAPKKIVDVTNTSGFGAWYYYGR